MRHFILVVSACLLSLPLFAQEQSARLKDWKDKYSYNIGMQLGASLREQKGDINPDQLAAGIKDAITMDDDQVKNVTAQLQKDMAQRQQELGEKNKTAGEKFLEENNVQIESWGPFAEGKNDIFRHEVLVSIASKYAKTVAQVILRWLTQRGVVVIPKSVRRERMEENFAIFDFDLTEEDMDTIRKFDTGASVFFDHRDPAMVKFLSEALRNT